MEKIPDIRDLHNILVCRGEGSLGDAIISSCCYREIKKANPDAKITVACFGSAYDFFRHNPYVDEVFKLPVRRIICPNQRWLSLFIAALKLRRKNFDLVLDSSDKDFFNWRMFKWIVGGDRVLDCFTAPVQPFGSHEEHGSKHEAAILRQLGISQPDKSYDLPILPTARAAVAQWLDEHRLHKYILFNPTGSVAPRRFKTDVLKEICAVLKSLDMPVVIPAMPSNVKELQQAFKDTQGIFVKQTADIFELFEWVRRSALVVTPDTAVVHIAAGFEKPSLVFYNTLSAYNAPDNPKAQVLETDRADVNVFDWWKLESIVAGFKKTV